MVVSNMDTKSWHPVYQELKQIIGVEATMKLFDEYKGTQLSFPIRLVSRQYLQQAIATEYDGTNKRKLAKKYGYSQRTIERIIRTIDKIQKKDVSK